MTDDYSVLERLVEAQDETQRHRLAWLALHALVSRNMASGDPLRQRIEDIIAEAAHVAVSLTDRQTAE